MGRMYAVTFEGVAVTAAQDFFELSPADDKPVILHACHLSQSSDVGDTAEEMLRVAIIRGHATGGSGGSSFTPLTMAASGAAAGAAAEINNTTIASTGTAQTLHAETINIRAGWLYVPTPECPPAASQASTTIVVRLMAAPADSLTMSGTLIFEELG